MAVQVSNLTSVAVRYPVVSCGLLLLLAFPAFQLFVYFFPLFISTALCAAALVTVWAPGLSEPGEVFAKDDDHSWLGRLRCLRECAKLWMECKLKIKCRTGSLQEAGDPTPEDSETEEEKRVHQLERTLRTLSFVSYEGIFSTDDTLLNLDEVVNDEDPEERRTIPDEDASGAAPEEMEEAPKVPAHELSEPSTEQVESMSDTGSQESSTSSWQEVESDTAQPSPA